jgi:hypothetical protein
MNGKPNQQDAREKFVSKDFEGYPTEIDYTFGYYRALSPTFLRLVTLNQFVSFPSRRPLRYLELGYGNGVSLNIHAAASSGEHWGTDVNPLHAAFANKLAEISGANVRALCVPFAVLLDQSGLPDFDVIVAHGIWSWISNSNRSAIIKLLRSKLVEGGILYISYNALPGSAAFIPLQQLMQLHSERCNPRATILDRLEACISLLSRLRDAGSEFFTSTPRAVERLEEFKTRNPHYLCHEYLTGNWNPSSFAEMARTMSEAGLRFVAIANLVDHYDELVFEPTALALLKSIDDPWVRETVRDLLRNRQFRRDVYVKGDVALTRTERDDILQDRAFVLLMREEQLPTAINTPAGRIELSESPFGSVIAALAEDGYRLKTVGELAKKCFLNEIGNQEIVRALLILVQSGIIHPVQDGGLTDQSTKLCQKLNEEILNQARLGKRITALASPITGGGIPVSRTHQLFLLALLSGAKSPDQWAKFAWHILEENASEGRPCISAGLRGATLPREALLFLQSLPILVAMGLIALPRPAVRTTGLPNHLGDFA